MKGFFFALIFFSSLMLADLNVIPLLSIGTTIYLSDLFFIYFFICAAKLFKPNYIKALNHYFLFFLGYLIFEVFYGMTSYGFRAIGETRYVNWLFFAFVPVYLYYYEGLNTLEEFDKLFKTAYTIIVYTVLFLLVVEIINGGRFFIASQNEDFEGLEDSVRGRRYLGSEETFNLGVFAMYLFIGQYLAIKKDWKQITAGIFLVGVMVFTQNRAALGSIILGAIVVFAFEKKLILMLKIIGIVALVLIVGNFLLPQVIEIILHPFISAINIQDDETGNWRLLVQAVAIQQGMQTPILGQGWGGYFEYYVEELHQTYLYPPHSMYVLLFQKCGLVGVLSYITALGSIIADATRITKITGNNPLAEKYRLLLKVLFIAQIPYGFAYGFTVYFGFYIGMFVILKIILETSINTEHAIAIS